ncbi:hypothetical protein [Enterococcus faecalis]|uniref:hypothetical protein n=1 Tax=Enterococcus faecalis TaxID=1351 RepID=UPI001F032681|nr:hypothetical protein [Enterococcus faecalis]HDT7379376.1 hypothetical protein [Enterococcus faecalis]
MKLVYILSGEEKNKNYVKKFTGSYCGFGNIEEAKSFTNEQAEKLKQLLKNNVGNAFVIDDDRGEEDDSKI